MNPFLYLSIVFGVVLITACFVFFPIDNETKENYKKNIKLDVSTEQMLKTEQRIIKFYSENNISPGTSIKEIAKVLKVSEGGTFPKTEKKLARLTIDEATGCKQIDFREDVKEEQKIFLTAHECAHLINSDPIPATRSDEKNKPEVEQLADYTAAALLMPSEEVYKFLVQKNYMNVSRIKRALIIDKMCRKYQVDEIIVMRRIREVYAIKSSCNEV